MNGKPERLSTIEWNFERVPESELVACCYWEYARESRFIRDVRQRSWEHWKGLWVKGKWRDKPRDPKLYADLERLQSIGYPADVFVRGISCPPDGVLPDALPLQPGEMHKLTGSFPKPWQALTREERNYRSYIGTDAARLSLLPFRRGMNFDAKEIARFVEARQREREEEHQQIRADNPKMTEETLLLRGKLKFPEIKPSLFYSYKETTIVEIGWATFTDDEIVNYFRKWVKENRPPNFPLPNSQGKKLNDWRVALNRLGIMRALNAFTFADHRFPKLFKDRGEKHCYAARKAAGKKFLELLPFLDKAHKPLSWPTQGARSR